VELGESGRSITLVKKLIHFEQLIALHQCVVRQGKWNIEKTLFNHLQQIRANKLEKKEEEY
jgi:hypothetical protein